MKSVRIGLLPRILIAIALGIGLGHLFPQSIVRLFATFNGLFGELLSFSIPLIILGLVTVAIADIGRSAGRMLLITVAIAYGATLFAGFLAYGTAMLTFPSLIDTKMPMDSLEISSVVEPYFTISIPPLMGVMTALISAFVFGLGMATLQSSVMKSVAQDFKDIVSKLISSVIIPLLPIYILGIFMSMAHLGQVYSVLAVFVKIIGVIFILHVLLLLIQFGVAGLVSGRNPIRLLSNMLPAYFTALGTQSSAATIPVSLEQTRRNGVSAEVAGFVIPLCATIHLSGSTLKIVSCSLALMIMLDLPIDVTQYIGFICMLGVTMIAAPGVPGGAIMACLGILQSMLGFDDNAQGLMIALYIAMDSFGTACNVTGDGAIAIVVDKVMGTKLAARHG